MSRHVASAAVVLLLVSAAALPAVGVPSPAAVDAPARPVPKPAAVASVADDAAAADEGLDGPGRNRSTAAPRIVELLPNPVAPGDAGEYVRIVVPAGDWTVTDGESAATVTAAAAGAVVLVADPEAVGRLPAGRAVDAGIALSNAGERVELRRGGPAGSVVDTVTYGRAPEGERRLRGPDGDPRWLPVGLRPREPVALGAANATAFVLPDAPDVAVAPIRDADRRVLLAGYTFASERVTRALVDARRRGVDVRVLLDGGPVGGMSARQAGLLDRLVEGGVEVRVVAGPHARFRYHHAKYAVADDTAVVLTENWKPSGTGGADNRGWGVVLRSPRAAGELAALFRADAGRRDAVPWREFRAGRRFPADDGSERGSYPSRRPPASVRAERVTLLTAPGNAEAGVIGAIDAADERVDVLQPTVADGPLLAATRRAAGRGVRVRLLLSGAWYVAEENAALVERLNRWADRTGAPFEARVADPAGRYGKVHAKGLVADDVAVVGSLNWNPTSARENREVAVEMRGADVAGYYRDSFEADWRAGRGGWRSLPPTLAIAAVGAVAVAVLFARRRFDFEGDGDRNVDGEGARRRIG